MAQRISSACATLSACITYPTAVTIQLLSILDTESSQYVSSPHVNPMQGGIFLSISEASIVDRICGKMLHYGSKVNSGTPQNGLFLMFLCESNRYFGKAPMKWPLTDRRTPQIWSFLNVSPESHRYSRKWSLFGPVPDGETPMQQPFLNCVWYGMVWFGVSWLL